MGEAQKQALRVCFDRRIQLEAHGRRITPDAGLPACCDLCDALGLTQAVGRGLEVKLIKMGGRIFRHSRHILFQLAEVAVSGKTVALILGRIGRLRDGRPAISRDPNR